MEVALTASQFEAQWDMPARDLDLFARVALAQAREDDLARHFRPTQSPVDPVVSDYKCHAYTKMTLRSTSCQHQIQLEISGSSVCDVKLTLSKKSEA